MDRTAGTSKDTEGNTDDGAINEKKRGKQGGVTIGKDDRMATIKSNKADNQQDKERGRGFHATKHRSHLMHAIEGLDRYPNYLSRWNNVNDVDELELALEQTLQKVREQKSRAIERRDKIQSIVRKVAETNPDVAKMLQPPQTWDEIRTDILDPHASNAIFRSRQFRNSQNMDKIDDNDDNNKKSNITVEQVMRGLIDIDLDAGYLEQLMDEEVTDVYSFPLLSSEFCTKVQTFIKTVWHEIENDDAISSSSSSSQAMITRDLDCLGLNWLNDLLFHLIVRPIARHLYQGTEIEGYNSKRNVNENDTSTSSLSSSSATTKTNYAELDWRHGFIASYSANVTTPSQILSSRRRLVPHTDDSEVTLNVCLGHIFSGGDVIFWGQRGDDDDGFDNDHDHDDAYSPQVGRAVIHAGRQFHEVTEVTSGDRFALIMWTRSWNGIRRTTCPCCWLNGRTNPSCVCGRKWN